MAVLLQEGSEMIAVNVYQEPNMSLVTNRREDRALIGWLFQFDRIVDVQKFCGNHKSLRDSLLSSWIDDVNSTNWLILNIQNNPKRLISFLFSTHEVSKQLCHFIKENFQFFKLQIHFRSLNSIYFIKPKSVNTQKRIAKFTVPTVQFSILWKWHILCSQHFTVCHMS